MYTILTSESLETEPGLLVLQRSKTGPVKLEYLKWYLLKLLAGEAAGWVYGE